MPCCFTEKSELVAPPTTPSTISFSYITTTLFHPTNLYMTQINFYFHSEILYSQFFFLSSPWISGSCLPADEATEKAVTKTLPQIWKSKQRQLLRIKDFFDIANALSNLSTLVKTQPSKHHKHRKQCLDGVFSVYVCVCVCDDVTTNISNLSTDEMRRDKTGES